MRLGHENRLRPFAAPLAVGNFGSAISTSHRPSQRRSNQNPKFAKYALFPIGNTQQSQKQRKTEKRQPKFPKREASWKPSHLGFSAFQSCPPRLARAPPP